MMTLTPEEIAILRPEYEKYLRDNERHRLYRSDVDWPMSFDDWWRMKADNAKE